MEFPSLGTMLCPGAALSTMVILKLSSSWETASYDLKELVLESGLGLVLHVPR